MAKIIKAEDIDFGPERSAAVISSAQKFIIPVPAFGNAGEPLVYPADHEKAGQPITDWQGKPIGDKGLVFFNAKDNAVQAVVGDGNGVVIINQVDEKQALQLRDKIYESQQNPNYLTLDELKEVLRYAREELGLGDMYNSDREFVGAKMTPAMGMQFRQGGDPIEAFGLMKRDDRDICRAVYIKGKGEFQGPAATPQQFSNGAVIVQQGDSIRLVQPEVFVETYRFADQEKYGFLTHTDARHDAKPRMDIAFLPTQSIAGHARDDLKSSGRRGDRGDFGHSQ